MDLTQFHERLANELPPSDLTALDSAVVDVLAGRYPQLPLEYFDLLRAVGHGAFADCTYAIYSGPVTASEVYCEARTESLNDFLLIGDDFCGYCLGYRGTQLGEVSDSGEWQPVSRLSLIDFLSRQLFDDVP